MGLARHGVLVPSASSPSQSLRCNGGGVAHGHVLCIGGLESLPLHVTPRLLATDVADDSTEPPPHGQLSVADVLEDSPQHEQCTVSDSAVAAKRELFQQQCEHREQDSDSAGKRKEQDGESPRDL